MYKSLFNCIRHSAWILPALLLGGSPGLAQEAASPFQVTVNSSEDGEIEADDQMTLREAIALQNGTLSTQNLSDAEQGQIQPAPQPKIAFNLSAENTTIKLQSVLPALETADLYINGSTQPEYSDAPIVALTPAEGAEVFRGLTVVANNITIKGLSLYGFTSILLF